MTQTIQIAVAGAAGAFGRKHLSTLSAIEGIEVRWLIGAPGDDLTEAGTNWPQANKTTELAEALADAALDAVILATPTPVHAAQATQCLRAGKHVLVEIPMADNLADAKSLVAAQADTGLVAMAGHTRRFSPAHRWLHQRIAQGKLTLQHLEVQTRFFRRTNTNALGQPRTWTDHLLWHHACHTVDLFHFQTGGAPEHLQALQGPLHPELGIAMDMSIGMKSAGGALCTLSLSFNNDGPFGTESRYICDHGTYIAHYDALVDGHGNPVDLSDVSGAKDGVEAEQRAFIKAIREQSEPPASVAQCLPAMQTLHRLEQEMQGE